MLQIRIVNLGRITLKKIGELIGLVKDP